MRKPGDKRFDPYWGYVWLRLNGKDPLFPGKYWVLEHRYKMAKKLGRRLRKGELVHHEDEDKTNNRITNLVLTTRKKHPQHHPVVHTKKTREKMAKAAQRWTRTPEFRKMASARAKRQHAEGNLGRATWNDAAKRSCKDAMKAKWKDDPKYRKKIVKVLLNQDFSSAEMSRRSRTRKIFQP